jgi:hypothetical protein
VKVRLSARVVDGRIQIDEPADPILFPEGAKLTLGVLNVVTKQCCCVFVPGILDDPRYPRKPRVRTRCTLQTDHEGPHSFE